MNAKRRPNFESGEVRIRLDRAVLAMGLGVPHCQEVMFVPSNTHDGGHKGVSK